MEKTHGGRGVVEVDSGKEDQCCGEVGLVMIDSGVESEVEDHMKK